MDTIKSMSTMQLRAECKDLFHRREGEYGTYSGLDSIRYYDIRSELVNRGIKPTIHKSISFYEIKK